MVFTRERNVVSAPHAREKLKLTRLKHEAKTYYTHNAKKQPKMTNGQHALRCKQRVRHSPPATRQTFWTRAYRAHHHRHRRRTDPTTRWEFYCAPQRLLQLASHRSMRQNPISRHGATMRTNTATQNELPMCFESIQSKMELTQAMNNLEYIYVSVKCTVFSKKQFSYTKQSLLLLHSYSFAKQQKHWCWNTQLVT